jgi:hypothetical protein
LLGPLQPAEQQFRRLLVPKKGTELPSWWHFFQVQTNTATYAQQNIAGGCNQKYTCEERHYNESKSIESYLARFSEFQNPERDVSPEENRLSIFVAAESESREIVSLSEFADDSSGFGAGSSELRSSASKGPTMFKLSISLRTRVNSACFCCKSSYASFIALLSKAVALRSFEKRTSSSTFPQPGRH